MAKFRRGRAGSGVAGDDENIGSQVGDELRGLHGQPTNLLLALGPVGDIVCVGEVEEVRARNSPNRILQDGEPTDAGIEDGYSHESLSKGMGKTTPFPRKGQLGGGRFQVGRGETLPRRKVKRSG